jgi:bacterioferritin
MPAPPDEKRREPLSLIEQSCPDPLDIFCVSPAIRMMNRKVGPKTSQSDFSILEESTLKNEPTLKVIEKVSRTKLIELLNEDLAREYQAIIGYVVYSQVIKGAEFMNIAGELEKHAAEELSHAIIIAKQIDYLGGMPVVVPNTVRTSEKATDMLQFDLEAETETIRNYRERLRQCEDLGEYAMSEQIREILIDEQDHQISLATALGKSVPAPRTSK